MDARHNNIREHIDKVDKVVGGDWNTPRSKIYIAVRINELEKGIERLANELTFEKEVNRRVELALASAYVK